MKRYVTALLMAFLCLLTMTVPVCASERTEVYMEETLEELNEHFDDSIPEEAKELLEALDLSKPDWKRLLSLKPQEFMELIKDTLEKQWREPLKLLAQTSGVLLLCSMLFPLKDSLLKADSSSLFHLAAVVCISTGFVPPVVNCMEECMSALENCAVFLLSLIPVLGGILLAGGHAATATGYQLLLFGVCQLVSQLAVSTALPLTAVYFALSMISGIFPNVGLQPICNGIRQIVCWGLGIATTLFVAFLSLQTFVSSNVDVVTMKASRFLMGSFIPVVGSILSEAFGAAQGCISMLKGTLGSFGVIVALCTLLPIILKIVLWYFVTWAASQISGILQVQEIGAVLKGANNTFAILLALLLCFLLLLVVSTTLIVFIGTGG